VGLDLPIPLLDALRLEDDFDSRGFAHAVEYALSGLGRKPYWHSGLFSIVADASQKSREVSIPVQNAGCPWRKVPR
jgi:hypothetical protein